MDCRHPRLKFLVFVFLAVVALAVVPQELEEIVVTAQKRTQDIQDVNMSVGIMQGDDITASLQGGGDVLGLASRLPSLHIESSNGRLAPRFYIRGVGNVDFDLNASQPVSFMYDDVVLENPAAKSFPLFDIDRLELLRGPQGTLFGRNTTGGILKFDSNKPTSDTLQQLGLTLGLRGHARTDVVLNGPVDFLQSDMRLALMINRTGDWIDNVAQGHVASESLGGFEDIAFRWQAAFSPTPQSDVLLNVHGRSLNGTPTIFYGNAIQQGSNNFVAGFQRDRVSLDAHDQHFQESQQAGVFATVRLRRSGLTIVSVTGIHSVLNQLSRGDVDGGFGSVFAGVLPSGPGPGIPFDAQTADGLGNHLQVTQEVRFEGKTQDRHWILGFYMFLEDLEIETFNFDTVFSPHTLNGYVNQVQDTRAFALFGTYELVAREDWNVSLGLRLSQDHKDFTAFRTQSPLSFLGIGGIGPLSVSPEDTVATWDINASFEVSSDVKAFARLAKGHRAPSVQGRLLFQDEISVGESETSLSLEIGIKALTYDRRLRTHASVYTYQVDDFQITKIGGAANLSELINVENLIGHGTEIEVDWYFNESLLMKAGASWNFTELDDPSLSVNGCGSANLLYGCTVTDPRLPNGEYLIHGNSLYNSPDLVLNFSLHYHRPIPRGRVELSTDWAIRSELRFTLYESLEYSDDGTTEGGVRCSVLLDDDRYRITLFGRNILDDQSMIGSVDFNNLTAMLNAPRTWGIEFQFTR